MSSILNPVNIIEQLKKRVKYTPDFGELRKQKNILVFVHDNMKIGYKFNYILWGSKYLGEGHTHSNTFLMKNAGGEPIVFEQKNGYHIRGQVFAVDVMQIMMMDHMHYNTAANNRMTRGVYLTDQFALIHSANRHPLVQCQMYIADHDWWTDFDLERLPVYLKHTSHGELYSVSQKFNEWK